MSYFRRLLIILLTGYLLISCVDSIKANEPLLVQSKRIVDRFNLYIEIDEVVVIELEDGSQCVFYRPRYKSETVMSCVRR